jgi:hypothetical protein
MAGGGFSSESVEVHDNEMVTAVPGGFVVTPMDKKPRKSAQGGGFFGFGLPQIPNIPEFTQPQIQGFATEFAPPAVRDVFRGTKPAPLRFANIPGFKLPTPSLLGEFTPRERESAEGFLAPFNTALSDVEAAVRQRFGRTGSQPQARLQTGFAG